MMNAAHYEPPELDAILRALANGHRREIVRILGLHPCTIAQLAALRDLTLPAMHKHVAILDEAGLVHRRKLGRSTFLVLNPRALAVAQNWLGQFHTYWAAEEQTLENYASYLDEVGPKEKS
jgi:DNA-binding transcriptional ArsR family regulator